METLTNEEALLSASRGAAFERHDNSSATPTVEKLIRSDNLDAIQEVDFQADDNAALQVGAHGSYSSLCTHRPFPLFMC